MKIKTFAFSTISIVLVALIVPQLALSFVVGNLDDLEVTRHAARAHIHQTWNLDAIRELHKSCKPLILHICPSCSQLRLLCPVERGADLWAGIILGTKVWPPVIVSAYAARASYWLKAARDDACLMGSVP